MSARPNKSADEFCPSRGVSCGGGLQKNLDRLNRGADPSLAKVLYFQLLI